MIGLADPRDAVPREILQSPGGFAWWYLELMDPDGSGVVLIWSWGLPFLPGYASAARRGSPEQPSQRPSLTVAVYQRGQRDCYALREYLPADCEWREDGWRFGRTTMAFTPGGTAADGRETGGLLVELDCPLAGSPPLTGTIEIEGTMPRVREALAAALDDNLADSAHQWAPILMPAFGTARLRIGDNWRRCISGRAYHDRNHADRPLHALGFRQWVWGHATLPDAERVFYVLSPHQTAATAEGTPLIVGLDLSCPGEVQIVNDLAIDVTQHRGRTWFGMPRWKRLRLLATGSERNADDPWIDFMPQHRVDDGPFYLRLLGRSGNAPGSLEVIAPDRVDLGRHRRLVRMAVSSAQRPDSFWLPLFNGPRHNRLRRLLRL